jgi:hypothetical protein
MDKGIGSLRPRNNLWLEKAGDIHLVICYNNEILKQIHGTVLGVHQHILLTMSLHDSVIYMPCLQQKWAMYVSRE